MPSASFTASRSYVRRSRRKGANRIPTPSRTTSAEPCEPSCPVPNQNIPAPLATAPGSAGSATGSGTSGSAIPTHHSPYDLRRKSPSHHEIIPGPSTSAATAGAPTSPATPTAPAQGYTSAMLPARKRPRRTCSASYENCTATAAHYLQYELPDEVLLTIFSYLLELDLCRVSQVCKRFQTIANDTEIWKRLYQSVYEYDLPLFNPGSCRFEFVSPEESDLANPWKESFRQLYRGIHVRPGYKDMSFKGRNLKYCNTIQSALDEADERTGINGTTNSTNSSCSSGHVTENCSQGPLVFIHGGTYRGEFLVIDSDVALIGAAPGNVAESVILERESESTIMFVEGAKQAYAGHLTLKFSPDVTSTVPHHKHF
ncbi:F-box domain-containing protein, partial [Oryctes borbonicus]